LALSYIGGRGTLWGGVLASFIFIPLFEYLKSLMELRLVIYGTLLIVVMVFFADGLVGLIKRIWERVKPHPVEGAV
jgi:branched-chain amino acid transport system permease protein